MEPLQHVVIAMYIMFRCFAQWYEDIDQRTFCYIFVSYVEHVIINFYKFAKCELY